MAPNTAGNPWDLDPVIHRDEEGNLVLPEPLQPFTMPSGPEVPAVEPSDLELSEQPRVEPGSPEVMGPT